MIDARGRKMDWFQANENAPGAGPNRRIAASAKISDTASVELIDGILSVRLALASVSPAKTSQAGGSDV